MIFDFKREIFEISVLVSDIYEVEYLQALLMEALQFFIELQVG